jgi:heme/copper-type cytochrome/quinol oxidase subunit 3
LLSFSLSISIKDSSKNQRIRQESGKNQARIKQEQARIKQESSKYQASKNQARIKEGLLLLFLFVRSFVCLFVCLFVCFCQNHIMEGSDLFKQALEGGSSLILLSSLFGRKDLC